ncbi:unnamed protein product, partial [Didymodactylos carnosus]
NQSEEVKAAVREANRIQHAARRSNETAEETEERRRSARLRAAHSRDIETDEQRMQRIESNSIAQQNRLSTETVQACQDRLQQQRVRQGTFRASNWTYKDEAFNYDPDLNYSNFPQIVIGGMSVKRTYCDALKFKGETPGMCCFNGKISLPELPELLEPLKSLMDGDHPKSKET